MKADILKLTVLFALSAEWDSDMASLLVLLHLLTPQPAGRKRPKKISVGEATDHLVKFQKDCEDGTKYCSCNSLCFSPARACRIT